MIEVTKLNGKAAYVNPDLIRFFEAAGDTVLVFTDGEKMMVRQKPEDIVQRVIDFRQRCMALMAVDTSHGERSA